MIQNNHLTRLLLLFVLVQVTTQQQQQRQNQQLPSSIQSGPDGSGSSFASSVTYDSHSNTILVTGSTFGRYFSTTSASSAPQDSSTPRFTSNCFVATVVLPDSDLSFDGSSSSKLQWSTRQVLGGTEEDTIQEACSMTMFHPQNKDKLFVLGFSEVGGKFDPLSDLDGFETINHYGLLLDVNIDTTSSSQEQPYRIVGGRAIQDFTITYPIMATIHNEYVYVVSQETSTVTRQDDMDSNNQFVDNTTSAIYDINNEVDPMRYFKYGDKYGMSLRRYSNYPLSNTNAEDYQVSFKEHWIKDYFALAPTSTSGTKESVHVSSIAVVNDDVFIVAGSTSGDGASVGRSSSTDGIEDTTLHGFVSKFYLNNGTIVPESKNEYDVPNKGTRRIQSSVENGRVWIAGMCQNTAKEPEAIYIIGAIEGKIETEDSSKFSEGSSGDSESDYSGGVDAYVMKIDVTTMEEIWIRQITGIEPESMVRGISCAIATNENAIWVGGVVQEDGVVMHADTIASFGGDDIFIVKLNSDDGKHIFTRQIGSTEDDGLAMRGGIVLDRDDNCIVVGNTYGSMYRVRSPDEVGSTTNGDADDNTIWISDVFVTTILSDGQISFPIAHPEFQTQPGSGSGGKDVVLPPEDAQQPAIEKSSDGSKGGTILIILLLLLIFGFVAVVLFVRNRSKLNRDANTDRSKVILFLNDFDVDDIDLKHSATGGWHCFYSNDLSNGNNRRSSEQIRSPSYGGLSPLASDRSKLSALGSDPLLTAPLTTSSLIKESLFMNDDDEDDDNNMGSGGSRFNESGTSKQRPGYNGLLDEYNSGWNDQRRQSDMNRQSNDDDQQLNDVWGKEIL